MQLPSPAREQTPMTADSSTLNIKTKPQRTRDARPEPCFLRLSHSLPFPSSKLKPRNPLPNSPKLRVAAIHFLNPAPLMYDFEHPPRAAELATRYDLHYTQPSLCARDLLEGRADLGLIPIAALTPELAVVPGCAIASLNHVRSILLLIKRPHTLHTLRTLAIDTASRSSVAYTEILLRKFSGNAAAFFLHPADPVAMLQENDAALLIGDPALLARERQGQIEAAVGPCTWLDIAHEWHTRTGLPWVAAVWAVRPNALTPETSAQLVQELNLSRDHGLAHIEDLVREWTARIDLPPVTIRQYLNHNIHYHLDPDCIRALSLFRRYAAEIDILPPIDHLRFL